MKRTEGAAFAKLKKQLYKDNYLNINLARRNMGMVFQNVNLFNNMTVMQNLVCAPVSLGIKSKEEAEKTALRLLDRIGLLDKKDEYPSKLSGGQRQRIAIIRSLCMEPKYMLFDEPTSALDPELTGEVLKVIRSLKGKDRTMIIVTHEMGFAKKVSDKIVFMANGQIEEQGTPKEIFDSPKSELLKAFLSNVDKKDGE